MAIVSEDYIAFEGSTLEEAYKKASLELQQQIENAEIAIIENAGHEVNTDNPTLLGQKLNVFFKQYV